MDCSCALLFLVYALGCSKGGGPAGDAGPFDLGSFRTDAGAVDSAGADFSPMSTVGIACGTTPCATMATFCCSKDYSVTGTCIPENAASCAEVGEYHCDGPEDCAPALPECCVQNGVSMCRAVGECAGLPSPGKVMCHSVANCNVPGSVCCPAPGSSPLKLCLDTACP